MLRGIDASSVQGLLPVKALAAIDIRFAVLKAQQGNDGFDPLFERNMKACLDAGIEVFPYCFFYPLPVVDKKTGQTRPSRAPKEQAKRFVDAVLRFPQMHGRPIFIDEEWPEIGEWVEWGCTAQSISDAMRENAEETHRLSGVRPILYTYLYWWSAVAKGADVSWASAYALWMAWYVKKWPGPGSRAKVPYPWTDALFWQWDGNGGELLPNGVDSDFCVFHGTEDDLRELAYGQKPADEPPPFSGPIVHANEEMLEAEIARYRERRSLRG